jgi:DNA-binding LytR/AlgR family response regulator
MISCILVDDEPLALELLSDYVERHERLTLVGAYSNPIEALKMLNEKTVDLIFLDVQMPELNGIQFMQIAGQKHDIILTTAYEKYAVAGFEHDAVDYLVKPISFDRFSAAIERFEKRRQPQAAEKTESSQNDILFVRSEYKILPIKYNDILYIESLGDYLAIHTKKGKTLTLETMKNYEKILPASLFIRVHKSFMVALNKIAEIERNEITIASAIVPIGETYKKAFWERINSK